MSPSPAGWRRVLVGALFATNAALAAYAWTRGDLAGTTRGSTIAAATVGSLVLAAGLGRLPLDGVVVFGGRALVLTTQALHDAGHLWSLYADWPRYDDALHFGAGVGVAVVFVLLAQRDPHLAPARIGTARALVLVVLATIAVAALWEVWEFAADRALETREQDNLPDTMIDILDGLAGALVASGGYVAWSRRQRRGAAGAATEAKSGPSRSRT